MYTHGHLILWCCKRFVSISKVCVWFCARWRVWTGTTGSPATRWWRCWGSTGTASWPCWRPSSTTHCSTGGSWTVRDHQLVTFSTFSIVSQSFSERAQTTDMICFSITYTQEQQTHCEGQRKVLHLLYSRNSFLQWMWEWSGKFNPTGLKTKVLSQ